MGRRKLLTDQLRDAVNASGMTHYRICKLIGLSTSMMSRFMSGEMGVGLPTVDKIGELLGLRIVADGKRPKVKARKGKVTR